MVEMALVFFLLIFSVTSLFEVGRAMWSYHTLASSVKKAVRVAMVHGDRCAEASTACPVSIGSIVSVIQQTGIGLDMSALQLSFISGPSTVTCAPASSCLTNTATWPAAPYNPVGQNITISGVYTFNNVMGMLYPGVKLGTLKLAAKSTEAIQF
jgi:hypothetical protein